MGLISKVVAWARGGRQPVRVLVVGLDRAGKTALLGALGGAPQGALGGAPQGAPAAAGDQEQQFQSGGVWFLAREARGAARHRALWERYYRRADGIIYVVDAADHLRMVVAREELELLVSHVELAARRVPLLVLASKSDAPHALPPASVAKALGLERVTDKPWHVAAVSVSGAGCSGGLHDGLAWLAGHVRARPPAN